MLAQGGKLILGILLLWVVATLGIDFLGSDSQFNNLPNSTGDSETTETDHQFPTQTDRHPTQQLPLPPIRNVEFARTSNLLAIGTFNIQVFGVAKMNNPNVVAVLADIARQFDVLAIQEVRSQDQSVLDFFVNAINQYGGQYVYLPGPRQGRTISKEQYVFIYDSTRVELVDPGYIVNDPNEIMHRSPMVSVFRTKVANGRAPFSFSLMNVHTDPDDVGIELDALADFANFERQVRPHEDDLIILGDLNASPDKFGPKLSSMDGIAVTVPPHIPTNTAGTKNYDNIVFNRFHTTEYVAGGVLDMVSMYNLTLEQAKLVSDHLPVWALFNVNETPPVGMARQPATLR